MVRTKDAPPALYDLWYVLVNITGVRFMHEHVGIYSGERGQRHARVHGYPQAALNRPRADESIVGYCRAENEVSWLNNFKAYGRTRVDSSTLVHSRVSTWYM